MKTTFVLAIVRLALLALVAFGIRAVYLVRPL